MEAILNAIDLHTEMKICAIGFLVSAILTRTLSASESPMLPYPYSIGFPKIVMQFSLPKLSLVANSAIFRQKYFDQDREEFSSKGFEELGEGAVNFEGPFWVGTYGSVTFSILVVKKSAQFRGEIGTVDSLSRYVRWWRASYGFNFKNGELGSLACVISWVDMFSGGRAPGIGNGALANMEIFSIPLDDDTFLEIGLDVTEYVAGSANKWINVAYETRDAIVSSIVFTRRSVGANQP
jgi:hypothetical protein